MRLKKFIRFCQNKRYKSKKKTNKPFTMSFTFTACNTKAGMSVLSPVTLPDTNSTDHTTLPFLLLELGLSVFWGSSKTFSLPKHIPYYVISRSGSYITLRLYRV